MPFTVIKGVFVPSAGRPDGDSIRFRPNNPSNLLGLRRRGRPPKVSANGTVQLRFEGIDSMEKRANPRFSEVATDSNLELCGVPGGVGEAVGYIASNQTGPHGRPISFVFAGDCPEEDGTTFRLQPDRVSTSVNYQQLALGHAYPLFYDTLYYDLRDALISALAVPRQSRTGVWAEDASMDGASYQGASSLDTMPPLFPKLWRRLDSYSRDPDIMNPSALDELNDYLVHDKHEALWVLSEARRLGFSNVVHIQEDEVSLVYPPEDLVFFS